MGRRSLFFFFFDNGQRLSLLRVTFTLARFDVIHASENLLHPLERYALCFGEDEVDGNLFNQQLAMPRSAQR